MPVSDMEMGTGWVDGGLGDHNRNELQWLSIYIGIPSLAQGRISIKKVNFASL